MQVSFEWIKGKEDADEELFLMMKSKEIKGEGVIVASVYQDGGTGKYAVDLADETIASKDGLGFAQKETAIRHAEKRFGIYKEPKKKEAKK